MRGPPEADVTHARSAAAAGAACSLAILALVTHREAGTVRAASDAATFARASVASAPSPVPVTGDLEGLEVHLADARPAPAATEAPDAEPLDDAAVARLLARLPDLPPLP